MSKLTKNIDEYLLNNGRHIYLLGEGRLVNLAAGDGHPAEIMDLSFALQFSAMLHVIEEGENLSPGVIGLPDEIDHRIAELKLETMQICIDSLTQRQKEYLASWQLE